MEGVISSKSPHMQSCTHETPTLFNRAPETYIHRVGRTGRFGAEGIAVSLIGNREVRVFPPSFPPSFPSFPSLPFCVVVVVVRPLAILPFPPSLFPSFSPLPS